MVHKEHQVEKKSQRFEAQRRGGGVGGGGGGAPFPLNYSWSIKGAQVEEKE